MDAGRELVFISYARADQGAAQRLHSAFSKAGIKAWLDVASLLPGQNWRKAVCEAITRCSHFVALLSTESIGKRGYVQSELRHALDVLNETPEGEIFLIPARIDGCQIPYEEMRSLHWVDLFPSFDDGVERIIRAINASRQSPSSEPLPLDVAAAIDIVDVRSIGGGAFAILNPAMSSAEVGATSPQFRSKHFDLGKASLPLATMLKDPQPDQITSMWGTACAFSFHLVLKPQAPWAIIRPPHVVVNAYTALPKYERAYPLPAMHAHIYYVEIDDPAKCETNVFRSKCMVYTREEVAERGWRIHASLADLTSIRLIPDVPEFYVVRVNALTPGIYDFDVAVDATLPGAAAPISIRTRCKYLFESK